MAGITAIKRIGYLHGGVTHPDGRRGFFKGAERDSREKGTSMSPGTDSRGNQRDQSSSGQKDDMSRRDFDTSLSNPDGRPNYKQTPPTKPKPTKDNTRKKNIFESYFNYNPVISTLEKITKSKFNTNINAKRREKYLNDLLETDPNEYNRVMGQFSNIPGKGIGLITGPTGIETQIGPDIRTDYGMPSAPPGMLTSNFEEIDGRKSLGDDSALEILGQKYKDTLPTFGSGKDDPYILPINYNTGALEVEEVEDVEPYNQFSYNEEAFGRGAESEDVTKASQDFNEGGRAGGGIMGTRARKAFGGIMDRVTGRKAYGLGSIFKSIAKPFKSVAKAAGKVLKSDIGKMALLAGAYYYGGGALPGIGARTGASGFGTTGRFGLSKLKGAVQGSDFFSKMLMNKGKTGFNPFKVAAMASPLLAFTDFAKAKPNEDIGMGERGGPLLNSQGDGSQGSISREIQEAYADGDSEKVAQLQKYYNYMLPIQSAVQEIGLPSSAQRLPYEEFGSAGYRTTVATGGRINKAEGGLMDLGGMEKDYRNEGGFVPIGEYEKKDDVPARLSVNEFVFTADAVRGAGGGDIDKGAEIMENVMKNLEDGGQMSKESQGNTGAQDMFSVSQRLGEVL